MAYSMRKAIHLEEGRAKDSMAAFIDKTRWSEPLATLLCRIKPLG